MIIATPAKEQIAFPSGVRFPDITRSIREDPDDPDRLEFVDNNETFNRYVGQRFPSEEPNISDQYDTDQFPDRVKPMPKLSRRGNRKPRKW
jgi:hypothetical protein